MKNTTTPSSSIQRLISGLQASWLDIFISLLSQILLVPLFLSHWGTEVYGGWLTILAVCAFLKFVDVGHQSFLSYEFLRLGIHNKAELTRTFFSSLPIAIALSTIQVALVFCALISTEVRVRIVGLFVSEDLISSASIALFMNVVIWGLIGNWSTITGAALLPFGYYPRIAWWRTLQTLVMALLPAIVVIMGGGFLAGLIAHNIAYVLAGIPAIIDMILLLRRENILVTKPNFVLGFSNFLKSIAVAVKSLLEAVRQQHVRIFIAPLVGATEVVAFSTLRTASNLLLQALGTITNPWLPELMRYLNDRDQERSASSICFVWSVLVCFLAPLAIVAQWLFPYIFETWTRGLVQYDPVLFALLNVGVLLYTFTQPAAAIIQGNNILRPQLLISTVAAVVFICGIFLTTTWLGIRGVAAWLTLTEVFVSVSYIRIAKQWVVSNGLRWPTRAMFVSIAAILTVSISMLAITMHSSFAPVAVPVGLVANVFVARQFWAEIPLIAQARIKAIARTWLPQSI